MPNQPSHLFSYSAPLTLDNDTWHLPNAFKSSQPIHSSVPPPPPFYYNELTCIYLPAVVYLFKCAIRQLVSLLIHALAFVLCLTKHVCEVNDTGTTYCHLMNPSEAADCVRQVSQRHRPSLCRYVHGRFRRPLVNSSGDDNDDSRIA